MAKRVFPSAVGVVAAAVMGAGLLTCGPASASTSASWTVQHMPPPLTEVTQVPGVSCITGGTCTAVGYYDQLGLTNRFFAEPFAERKTSGGGWTVQSVAPVPPEDAGFLLAVSCTSAAFCMAVGQTVVSETSGAQPLSETWDGTAWAIQPVPDPPGGGSVGLAGVSCTSATFCMAVGTSVENQGPEETLAEIWDGSTWTIAPTADGFANASFNGVSCPSPATCIAVGRYVGTAGIEPLAESWNGSNWSTQPVPSPAGAGGLLSAVSCSSATACTTVGFYFSSPTTTALIDRWNGTRWKEQTDPGRDIPVGVSCPTARNCTSVGLANPSAPAPTAESWNPASGWTIDATAVPGRAAASRLQAVSCLSPANCTATGYFDNKGVKQLGQPLAEHG
ncbi:MAG TPA: hypothetical protein VGI31_09040 [Streptosporangiaceae bacterium]